MGYLSNKGGQIPSCQKINLPLTPFTYYIPRGVLHMTTDIIDKMPNTQKKDLQSATPLAVRERAVSVSDDGTKRLDIKKVLRSDEGRLKLIRMTSEISRFVKE